MKVTFLIRTRMVPGAALHNAAAYDALALRNNGHVADFVQVPLPFRIPSVSADLLVIEGAGWCNVADIGRCVSAGIPVLVRVHGAPEFLYYENPGVCTAGYLAECRKVGALIGFVSQQMHEICKPSFWVPMVYPIAGPPPEILLDSLAHIHVGSFGAIRPLKNHLGGLLALGRAKARWFSGEKFSLHVNSTRIEDDGAHILPELKGLAASLGITLVCHPWMPTDEFKKTIIPYMDMGLFPSFAESYCLTAADFVSAGKPCVLSEHIPWAAYGCGTTIDKLSRAIRECITNAYVVARNNWNGLMGANMTAERLWSEVLSEVGSHAVAS